MLNSKALGHTMLEVMVIYSIFTEVAVTSKILAFGLSDVAYR